MNSKRHQKNDNIGQTSHFSSEVLPTAHVVPKDFGARDPDLRPRKLFVVDGVNEDEVTEDIGAPNPDLRPGQPFADVVNQDFVPEDVIDKATTTSALLDHMTGACQACVTLALEIGGGLLFFFQDFWDFKKDRCGYFNFKTKKK